MLSQSKDIIFIKDNIGMIIIDECHDLSYQQQSDLRYCAIKVALMRAKLFDIPIVFETANEAVAFLIL